DRYAVKLLEQREHDVRLPGLDLVADRLQFVLHAERLHLVPGAAQRGHHVVFGFPLADLLLAEPLGRVRGYEIRVDEHQDAKPFHSAIHLRRDGPNNACMVFAGNRIVNSAMSRRSEPAARSFSFLQRAIMSSSTASTVS